jgi:hypothetical protein
MIPGLDSTLSNIGPQSGPILDKVEFAGQQKYLRYRNENENYHAITDNG